jgi:hypothetical protein
MSESRFMTAKSHMALWFTQIKLPRPHAMLVLF